MHSHFEKSELRGNTTVDKAFIYVLVGGEEGSNEIERYEAWILCVIMEC